MSDTKTITYLPQGEMAEVTLTVKTVEQYLTTPTKSGQRPTHEDVVKFMMLCRARELNPWVGDAFLVGYDSKDGPQFNLITSFQALLKRAELHDKFRGLAGGVIVDAGGKIETRDGEFLYPKDKLLGAWATVHRDDRQTPTSVSINLDAYNSGYGRWKTDAPGMLVKCAKSKAIREAFPNQTGQLYTADEQGAIEITASGTVVESDDFGETLRAAQDPQPAKEGQQDAARTKRDGPRKAQAGTQVALIDTAPSANEQ